MRHLLTVAVAAAAVMGLAALVGLVGLGPAASAARAAVEPHHDPAATAQSGHSTGHVMPDGTTMNADHDMAGTQTSAGAAPGHEHDHTSGNVKAPETGTRTETATHAETHGVPASNASPPRALVISTFASFNGLVLIAAALLRRRTAREQELRRAARSSSLVTTATPAGSLS